MPAIVDITESKRQTSDIRGGCFAPLVSLSQNLSGFSRHFGDFFYVTTSGSTVLTGAVDIPNASALCNSSAAVSPSSGLFETMCGGLATLGGPLTYRAGCTA